MTGLILTIDTLFGKVIDGANSLIGGNVGTVIVTFMALGLLGLLVFAAWRLFGGAGRGSR